MPVHTLQQCEMIPNYSPYTYKHCTNITMIPVL